MLNYNHIDDINHVNTERRKNLYYEIKRYETKNVTKSSAM